MSPADRLPTGTVTFLFTDIEGSTRMVQELGDVWVGVLEDHNRLLSAATDSCGGVVVATDGDAVFAVFAQASDAVRAAVTAQRDLASYPGPAPVRVRMGLHTGAGLLGGTDYVGLDVHRAARVADSGHGGQVVLSEATAVLVERELEDGVTLRDLGKHRLKDLSQPETLFQLVIDGLRNEFPPLRTLDAVPNNLPLQVTSFVGREKVLAEALALLERSRLLTLTGPGGTGKTRLSLQIAAEVAEGFGGGVFFVELAPVSDPEIVPSQIISALGVQGTTKTQTPAERALEVIAGKNLLLVLDNFEQLLPAAPFVGEMMRASPDSKFVVSSRAPLRISGEQEYPVPPLALPGWTPRESVETLLEVEAVRLFAERAMAVRPDFRVTEQNAVAVAELVERLDGLPLAIELVVPRLRLFPVETILERLDAKMLSSGSVDLPDRQQTIEGAIDWSHDLLDTPLRRLFAVLSVFAGGARFEEIEKVCSGEDFDLIEGLTQLVDHSLVRRVEGRSGPRFRMLHVIREYAMARLDEAGDFEMMRRRHATAYAELVEEAAPHLLGRERRRWLDLVDDDHDNLRAAMEWATSRGEVDLALRISWAAWRFWQARGHLHEARRRIEAALALPRGDEARRAKAVEALGGVLWWQGDMASCHVAYREAVEMQRRLGDPKEIANALYNLSLAASWDTGDTELGKVALREAEQLYTELGDVGGLGDVEWGWGVVEGYVVSDWATGRDHMLRSIEYYRQAGNEFGMGWGIYEVADASWRLGDHETCWEYLTKGLRLFYAHEDVSAVVLFVMVSAGLAQDMGDRPRALRLAGGFHALRIASGADLALFDLTKIPWLEFEALESLSGEDAVAYREGLAMTMEQVVEYTLRGPTD